jgi:peptidyl-prolyl cis-trans isomerase D
MLDAMRRGVANFLAKILLGLLLVAFAIWGIGNTDFLRNPLRGNALATVGRTQITVEEFKQAYKDETQSIARQLGRALTPDQAQVLGVPARALSRLIGSAAIDRHAGDLGITVVDEIVANLVKQDPAFADSSGQFNRAQFRDVLAQRGYRSEEEYIRASRRDLQREQLTDTLGAAVVPLPFMVDAEHRYRGEARVIEYLVPDFSKLVTVPVPAQDKLKEFFQQSQGKYVAQEERKANLLLVSHDAIMARIKVGDDEVKAAYEVAKGSFDVPERRRITQLAFPDKAAAEKAYAELSKAKDAKEFEEAAKKLGFSASDLQLGPGLLTKAEMIDSKIADAAFKLKKDELSRPVEGQYSVVLLRVPEIADGKTRTFDEVKGEIRDRIANERVGQELQSLHDRIEAGRAKATPLKEIAQELKLPMQEVSGLTRTGRSADGKAIIVHNDAAQIAEAVFAASPGVETEVIELTDGGYAWFDLVDVTPERQRSFEEVEADVKAGFMEEERRKEIAALVARQIDALKPGEGLDRIAKALNGKIERTPALKRTATTPPPGLTAALLQQAFALAKGGVASAPAPDGKSRIVFRVADIVAAAPATPEEAAALKADLARQMRIDILDQYVSGLRTRYGFTINQKLLVDALGSSNGQPEPAPDADN